MKTEPRSRSWRLIAALVPGVLAVACSAPQALRDILPGAQTEASPLSAPMTQLERLPYAAMLVRVGDRFQALLLLAHVSDDGIETWYGADGLVLQMQDQRVIHSRGLPVDIFESHVAGTSRDEATDCGEGSSVTAPEWLHYTRLREQPGFFTEQRETLRCTRESIVTPGYSGAALRVDERIALLPDPRRQMRTRWLAEDTGQLLRVEYGEHPWYPEIALYLIKPVAPR